jgi:hypothetical protein
MDPASQPTVTFAYFSYTKQTKRVMDAMAEVFRQRGWNVQDAPIGFTDHRWAPRFSTFPLPMLKLLGMFLPQLRGATGEIVIPEAAGQTGSDLVVIGSPTWFFRKSIPMRSYLKSAEAKRLLGGTRFSVMVVCRRYWSINGKNVRKRAEQLGGSHAVTHKFTFEGGQVRSLLSLISYLTTGETRERYMGIRIPPANLRDEDMETARSLAAQLIDDSPSRLGSTAQVASVSVG